VPDVLAAASPRRLFCVFEHSYASVAVADLVASGRFPIQGVTLTLGLEPDWLAAPLPQDKEWRLEWSKFYYGLDLATAAEVTGALKYLTAWQRLVTSWIAQVPIDHDPSDVMGRRIQNWLYAWSRFAERFDVETSMPGIRGAHHREPARAGRVPARSPHARAEPPDTGALRLVRRRAQPAVPGSGRQPAAVRNGGTDREPAGRRAA
jgi:hypothetical protein